MDDVLGRFDLTTDELVVGPLRLTVTRPRSAEELIDETDYEHDERLPYWAELWPSALVLAEHLAARDLRGRRVVELGCGVGLPAIVAALAGADVLASDWYADALAFAGANAAAAGTAIQTLLVDWTAPPPALLAMPAADLVVGADVLYEERNGPALAALVPQILAPGGELVVADPRRPHAAGLLDRLTDAGWALETSEIRHGGRMDESGQIVHLHRLTAPVPAG